MPQPPSTPATATKEDGAPTDAHDGDADADVPAVGADERSAMEECSRGFEYVTGMLTDVAAQRKDIMRALSEILWQLRRRDPSEDLEVRHARDDVQRPSYPFHVARMHAWPSHATRACTRGRRMQPVHARVAVACNPCMHAWPPHATRACTRGRRM